MRPKSVILKMKEGNPGKRKLPKDEPIPVSELPDPPETLDAYALEEWNRVGPGLAALGILAGLDRGLLAAYCTAYGQWRTAREEMKKRADKGGPLAALIDVTKAGNVIQNPLVGIANTSARDFVKYGDMLGMGESARARLGIERAKGEAGKFAGLVGIGGGRK